MASILVLDDEAAIRGLVRASLEPMGYTIREAVDGWEGIDRFRDSPTDLVITDMDMPRGDGLTVIRELQADDPTVKILTLSGSAGPGESSEALRLGGHAMLAKPFSTDDLREAVALYIRSPNGKAPPSSGP